MAVRFGADELRRAYENEKARAREWGRVVARLYVRRIDTLYAAENAQTLRALRSLRFHALTGPRKGQYSLDLGPAYRLIVTFEDRAMTVVQVEEVSKHYDDQASVDGRGDPARGDAGGGTGSASHVPEGARAQDGAAGPGGQ